MTKAPRLNIHPRAIRLVRILARGEREFYELHPRDKEILFQTIQNGFSPDDIIPERDLRIYEARRELQHSENRLEQIKSATKVKIYETRKELGV